MILEIMSYVIFLAGFILLMCSTKTRGEKNSLLMFISNAMLMVGECLFIIAYGGNAIRYCATIFFGVMTVIKYAEYEEKVFERLARGEEDL